MTPTVTQQETALERLQRLQAIQNDTEAQIAEVEAALGIVSPDPQRSLRSQVSPDTMPGTVPEQDAPTGRFTNADMAAYVDTTVQKPMTLDEQGFRAQTTPGSRLCYVCLRGFPTTLELWAHIGTHHGRTDLDYERAEFAHDAITKGGAQAEVLAEQIGDNEEAFKAVYAQWRTHSRDAAETRKQNAAFRARDTVLEDGGDLYPEVIEEESLHARQSFAEGDPTEEEARARVKSEAVSVAVAEAMYREDIREPLSTLRAEANRQQRRAAGWKQVLVRSADDLGVSRLIAVDQAPGEELTAEAALARARTLHPLPEARNKEGEIITPVSHELLTEEPPNPASATPAAEATTEGAPAIEPARTAAAATENAQEISAEARAQTLPTGAKEQPTVPANNESTPEAPKPGEPTAQLENELTSNAGAVAEHSGKAQPAGTPQSGDDATKQIANARSGGRQPKAAKQER